MNIRCINCQDCENLTSCQGLHDAKNQANICMSCRIITGTYRVQFRGRVRVYQGRYLQHGQTTVTIDTDKPWTTVGDPL